MVDQIIRPADLPPQASPVASSIIPVDNGTQVGGATIQAIVESGRPAANRIEAETGTDAHKAMTPLTVAQKIEYEIGRTLASKAQGDLADTAVQSSRAITAGSGLDGGGNLTADRTISLSAGSVASLAKADTAVQPGALGALAAKSTINNSDWSGAPLTPGNGGVTPGGTVGQVLTKVSATDYDAAWIDPSGGGARRAACWRSLAV